MPNHTQQYPQLQYTAQQSGPYQASYQIGSNAGHAQPAVSQQIQQTCYNCGAPDHWAQNCPEPRREVPIGSLSRQNYSQPFKRHKANPPVVTKYTLPPHVQQHQGPPQGYAPSPYGQAAYPQYAGPHAPPTPISAHSPSTPHWQQQPHYPQYQQNYTQGYPLGPSPPPPPPPQQQQPYAPSIPPTPATPYGPPYGSQNLPSATHFNPASYQQTPQYRPHYASQPRKMSNASSGTVGPQSSSYQNFQRPPSAPIEATKMRKSSTNSSVSMHSMSVTPTIPPAEVTRGEGEDDELSKLDIPDIPTSTGGNFATLIERPLPSNFIVADALEPFPAPPPDRNGFCQSKYFKKDEGDMSVETMIDAKEWEDMRKDPIFNSVSDHGHVICIDDAISKYHSQQPDDDQYSVTEDGEVSPLPHPSGNRGSGWDVVDTLEHSLNSRISRKSGNPKRYETVPVQHVPASRVSSRKLSGYRSEDLQAPYVGTGAARTIRPPARPFPPPPPINRSPSSSPERTPPRRGRTPSMSELNEMYAQALPSPPAPIDHTEEAESKSKPDFSGNRDSEKPSNETNLGRPTDSSCSSATGRPSMYDGVDETPFTVCSSNGSQNGHAVLEKTNTRGKCPADGKLVSPTQSRPDKAHGRKRDYSHQGSSDEGETPKRRQVDDVTPKLKRRQPKVAAAYR
ncbi:MAG: hypothetical protein LQ342_000860 [Letrouitia transgressa]|nr:MAG: hypothetical protein LQ342_000860 [Letrouitia transgressa]